MKRFLAKSLLLASVAFVTVPPSAFAQQLAAADQTTAPTPQEDDDDGDDRVIVTGSLLVTDGTSAPTPVTVVSAEQLLTSTPTLLADGLAQLPQFRGSWHTTSLVSPVSATGAFANLRGLGFNRTLILLEGRRLNPSEITGVVDINTLPSSLVERVDVVTGGASAAYGSDAVAGVVNFILDHDFEGFKVDVNAGTSERDDHRSTKVSLAGGVGLMDDKLHVIGSYDYYNNTGIWDSDERDWNRTGLNIIQNPTYPADGRTAFLWRTNTFSPALSPGGLILAGPLRGTEFLNGGGTRTYNFGTESTNSNQVGGDGFQVERGTLEPSLKTLSAFSRATYDWDDNLQVFAEASYNNSATHYGLGPMSATGARTFTIFNDNPYIPTSVRQRMAAQTPALTSFALTKLALDWGEVLAVNEVKGARVATGFDATVFGDWNLRGYIAQGQSNVRRDSINNFRLARVYEAVNVVTSPTTGQPVCASTVVNPNNGCVPINVLGTGTITPAALDYITGGSWQRLFVRQNSASLTLAGSPFELWSRPVAVAAGISWREITGKGNADPLSKQTYTVPAGSRGHPTSLVGINSSWFYANQFITPKSTVDVMEYFGEIEVPLLEDAFLAQQLSVNAGVRYADYNVSGGITAWKVGASWALNDELRFRATRSRDVRAPNLSELFGAAVSFQGFFNDPVARANVSALSYSGVGNPNLVPETSDSTVVGAVYEPAWFDGLSVTLDYYDITLHDAIGGLGAQILLNRCSAGETQYCTGILRTPAGVLQSVTSRNLNLNQIETSGVDLEVSYDVPLESWNVPGELSLRYLHSYLDHFITTDPFGSQTSTAGVNGGEASGLPEWQVSLNVDYSLGPWKVSLRERAISSGRYSTTLTNDKGTNSVDKNEVDGADYTDLTVQYEVGPFTLYGTINNLLDSDPPESPTRTGIQTLAINTNPALYDVVGRTYTAGLRFRY